jgi:hypothetical protein
MYKQFWFESLKVRDHSNEQDVHGRIILKRILRNSFIHSQALIVQDGPLASLFGVSWSNTYRHAVGLFWTNDQPVADIEGICGLNLSSPWHWSVAGFYETTFSIKTCNFFTSWEQATTGVSRNTLLLRCNYLFNTGHDELISACKNVFPEWDRHTQDYNAQAFKFISRNINYW